MKASTFIAKKRTSQEVYDFVMTALAKQQWQPSHYGEKCMYRGRDGCKCAVGHIIPDDLYDREFEQGSVHSLIHDRLKHVEDGHKKYVLKRFLEEHRRMLILLQRFHDRHLTSKDIYGQEEDYCVVTANIASGGDCVHLRSEDAIFAPLVQIRTQEYFENKAKGKALK